MSQADHNLANSGIEAVIDDAWPAPEFKRASSRLLKGTFIMVTNPWAAYPAFVAPNAPNPPSPRVLPTAAINSLRFDGSSGFWGQNNVRALQRSATGETTVSFTQSRVDGEYYLWHNTQSNIIEGRMQATVSSGGVPSSINQFYLLRQSRDEWHMVLRRVSLVAPPIPDLQIGSNAKLVKARTWMFDLLF